MLTSCGNTDSTSADSVTTPQTETTTVTTTVTIPATEVTTAEVTIDETVVTEEVTTTTEHEETKTATATTMAVSAVTDTAVRRVITTTYNGPTIVRTAATNDYIGFPTADEVIKKSCELLGVSYGTAKGTNANAWGKNGTATQRDMLPASLISSIDCTGLVYWTMASLGYSTSGVCPGSYGENPVPVDTYHWFGRYIARPNDPYDYSNAKITCNGKTYSLNVLKNLVNNKPYYEMSNGSIIPEGSVVVAYDSTYGDHAWIYIGEFSSASAVRSYLVGIGVPESRITVYDWGNCENHWRIEATVGRGVIVDNGVDVPGIGDLSTLYISAFGITSVSEPEEDVTVTTTVTDTAEPPVTTTSMTTTTAEATAAATETSTKAAETTATAVETDITTAETTTTEQETITAVETTATEPETAAIATTTTAEAENFTPQNN